jgi:N6-adenosine-specific RNA methylase IME4
MDSLSLIPYDVACRAVAEARSVDELKDMLDIAAATKEYARRAKNHQMEADAVEIRLRATRRLNELIEAQRQTVGLATGREGKRKALGLEKNPSDRPTLAEAGIDKNLAHHARVLGALDEAAFADKIAEARSSVTRAYQRVIREVEIDQQRAERHAEPGGPVGGTIEDLIRLAKSGRRFGAILADPPWGFQCWDGKDKRVASRGSVTPYDTMEMADIAALPVEDLALPDCLLLLWVVWPTLPQALEIIRAWGFDYKTCGFAWTKADPPLEDNVYMGLGYWTRANTEVCLLATRGSPKRLNADVLQAIIEPRREHSRKPDCVHERIERLVAGPYLELFARRERPNWTCWGNEIPPPLAPADTKATHEATE